MANSLAGRRPSITVSVDRVIHKLLKVRSNSTQCTSANSTLTETEIRGICIQAREIFLSQPVLLEIEAPIKIFGDIHGHFVELLRLFECAGFPPESSFLFLGDYVDRGKNSIECMVLLMAYKIKYPTTFYLLRGNHECANMSRTYGFFDECKQRYSAHLWENFVESFNCLPVMAIINRKILCFHGGLSPELKDFNQIRSIIRPIDVPEKGLLADLLWADPHPLAKGWQPNKRGTSHVFGPDIVIQFLKEHNMDLICRAHQFLKHGFEYFANRKLVTIFSVPDYCGKSGNDGGFMQVDEKLFCSFHVLKPMTVRRPSMGRCSMTDSCGN